MSWLLKLERKHDVTGPLYAGRPEWGELTATAAHAREYATEAAAAVAASKLPPHAWGGWTVVERE